MINPRQLAPTVGRAHGGVEFLKGSLSGFKKLAIHESANSLSYIIVMVKV